MTKVNTAIKFTYADYKSLPESETKRYELLSGECVMTPSPTFKHQSISSELEYHLNQFVREKRLGSIFHAPLDVVLGKDVVQPDVLYITHEQTDIIQDDEIRGAPSLIIEILSPATAERDRTYKKRLYARHGVREYWLVDPDSETVDVLVLGKRGFELAGHYETGESLSSPLLAGLKLALEDVFNA